MAQAQKLKVRDYRKKPEKMPSLPVRRDWRRYNRAAETKIRHMWPLAAHLSNLVGQPPQEGRGRPKAVLADIVFASIIKVSMGLSARDFTSLIELAHEMGLIATVPRWPTVLKYLADPDMTELLKALVTISSLPCRQLEEVFCVDASGLSTSTYLSWNDKKWGTVRDTKKNWVKMHAIIGVTTQVVVAGAATEGTVSDQTPFPEMAERAAREYRFSELVGDKGYTSRFNLELVNQLGGVPYIAFAGHHNVPVKSSGSTWDKMIRYYVHRQDEWDSHYRGPRAKVESTFGANKCLFGSGLFSKKLPAQINETYYRLIAHNLTRLIHVSYEMDVLEDVTDFGVYETIQRDNVPTGRLATYALDDEPEAHTCDCPPHRDDVHPFWALPGQPLPAPRGNDRSDQPSDSDSDYRDNVIYLWDRVAKPSI